MLENITFGQYYPSNSVVHRMDPRMKILLLIVFIVIVFCASTLYAFIPVLLFLVLAVRYARLPFRLMLKGIKPLRIILIFTFVLNLFFIQGQTVLVMGKWKDIQKCFRI